MARVHILWLLCVALLAARPAQAAGVPQQTTGTATGNSVTTVNGVFTISFRLSIASTLPAGTAITCRARIVPGQSGLNLRPPQQSTAPEETAAGVAAVTGPMANCTAEIPFSWTLTSRQSGVMLSYEIDAMSSAGAGTFVIRSSAQQNIHAAFPALGGNSSLSFNVTF